MFVDTHAHLTDEAFKEDFKQIVQNAKNNRVGKIITSGYDLASSQEAVAFAEKFDDVYASIGVYPENANEYTGQAENHLKQMCKNPKVVAIGEIGLQYTDNMPPKEVQKDAFARQIKLAYSLQKPIVIHCRDAFGDTIEMLKENKDFLKYGGTMHCFSGSLEFAREVVKLGLYISVGGVSTFKNATRLQEALKEIPLERIILETDCPYLSPSPFRGQRNEPARVVTIAENLAKLKNTTLEEVEKITSENVRRLFGI